MKPLILLERVKKIEAFNGTVLNETAITVGTKLVAGPRKQSFRGPIAD